MSDLLDWGPINGSNRHLCCFIGSKAADDRDQIATTKQQKHTETQERDGTGWNDALLNRPPECRHHEQSERPVHRRWDQGLRVQSPGADRREIREVRDIQVSLEKKCVSLVEVLQLDASTSTPSLKVYLYKLGTITLRNIQRCKACGANQWYFGSSSPPLLARGFQSSVVSSCLHLSLCSRVTQRFTFFATTSSSQGGVRLVTNLEKNSTGIKLKLSSSYRSWLLSLLLPWTPMAWLQGGINGSTAEVREAFCLQQWQIGFGTSLSQNNTCQELYFTVTCFREKTSMHF